jgi:vitamin B12 transporter
MKQYNEQKILAALLCGAMTFGGAEYASAAENVAEDLSVEEFSLDDYVVTANRMKVRSQESGSRGYRGDC